ncbi:hypothetical protein [Stenotrophomonas rhizophila]
MNARTVASVPVRRCLLGRASQRAPWQRAPLRDDDHGRVRDAG